MENKGSQNYNKHTRYDPVQHFFWLPVSLITIILTITFTVQSIKNGDMSVSVFILIGLVIMAFIAGFLARRNPLKAQDRIIRLEEQFRYYMLTGEAIDPRLTVQQLIALRFASDEEFPTLAKRTAEKNLSPDIIKKQIKNWRSDAYRI